MSGVPSKGESLLGFLHHLSSAGVSCSSQRPGAGCLSSPLEPDLGACLVPGPCQRWDPGERSLNSHHAFSHLSLTSESGTTPSLGWGGGTPAQAGCDQSLGSVTGEDRRDRGEW